MAKSKLKFDIGKLREFVTIYKLVSYDDPYGSSPLMDYEEVGKYRAWKQIKSKTSQSQTQAGAFDFYQVYEFIIRDNPNIKITKDMIVHCGDSLYTLNGVTSLENIPNYISLYTMHLADSDEPHQLWTKINSQPIEADYETIIKIV